MRCVLLLAVSSLALALAGCDGPGPSGPDADIVVGCGEEGTSCNMSTECPDLQVCADHHCVCAFNRTYEIEIVSASIYSRTDRGNCWDGTAPACEDPDPYIEITVGEGDRAAHYTTEVMQDSTYAIWNETFEVYVGNQTKYGFTLYDDDGDDPAETILSTMPLFYWFEESNLRNARISTCNGDEGRRTCVDLIISPL